MPSAAELGALYSEAAYFEQDDRGYETDYLKQQATLEREAARRLSHLDSYIPARPRQLLDIGCAAGFFLNMAQQRHWQAQGVEISPGMAAYARAQFGLTVHPIFNPANYTPATFEAVTLWEVVEHLPAPLNSLSDVYSVLKQGGVIALSTPNTGHWQAQRRPAEWSQFKPPVHVVYFTEATLRLALQHAGFVDIQIFHTRLFHLSPRAVQALHAVRASLGDGADPRTPLWPLTSLLYRFTSGIAGLAHLHEDGYLGLEAYAQKPCP